MRLQGSVGTSYGNLLQSFATLSTLNILQGSASSEHCTAGSVSSFTSLMMDLWSCLGPVAGATCLSVYAVRKGSLSRSGGLGAFIVGFFSAAAGVPFMAVLLAFFFSSSKLTKKGKAMKQKLEEDYAKSSCRNWKQVPVPTLVREIHFRGSPSCWWLVRAFKGGGCNGSWMVGWRGFRDMSPMSNASSPTS